jgi:DNA modification methylase
VAIDGPICGAHRLRRRTAAPAKFIDRDTGWRMMRRETGMKPKEVKNAQLVIEHKRAADLKPDPENARTHSPAQIEQLRKSIREFGITRPLLLKPGNIIGAGNGTFAAAIAEGIEIFPTITLQLSPAQWKAYAIADNQLALKAGWNLDVLRAQLADLQGMGVDLDGLGFKPVDLRELIPAGRTGENETPEVQKAVITRAGDVWCMGAHRVVCGDATDPDDVKLALAGNRPKIMLTDPPYGIEYDPGWRDQRKSLGARGKRALGKVENDQIADWRAVWALFPGDVVYVWHAALQSGPVQESLAAAGFPPRSQIVWVKSHFAIGRGDYHWKHEACWYAVRKGKPSGWAGDRKQTTIWEIDAPQVAKKPKEADGRDDRALIHSTQKPVECMRRPILNSTAEGDLVFDPFLGSGTTVIACQIESRRCCGLELNPAYVDVIVRRWEAFTGAKAMLEETGKTFEQVARLRTKRKAA